VSGERDRQILSQEEISALLSVVDRSEIAMKSAGAVNSLPRYVVTDDFRNPNWISKNQVKVLQGIHESLARLCGSALSVLLRRRIGEVARKSVEQTNHPQFVASVAQRTWQAIFNSKSLNGAAAGGDIPDDRHQTKASEPLRRIVHGEHQR
jgi:flagellar motor switch protein FliM